MNSTPRLPSAFSKIWNSVSYGTGASAPSSKRPRARKPNKLDSTLEATQNVDSSSSPLVPNTLINVPSQRLYIVAFYIALNAWRLYKSWLTPGVLDSLWLYLKCFSIDGIFLFGILALRIPRLTPSIFIIQMIGNMIFVVSVPVCASPLFPIIYRLSGMPC